MFIHFPFQMDTQASFIKAKTSKSVFLALPPSLPPTCFPFPLFIISFFFKTSPPLKLNFPRWRLQETQVELRIPVSPILWITGIRRLDSVPEPGFCLYQPHHLTASSVHLLIHLHNELSNTQALRKQAIQGEEIRLLIQAKEAPR